MKKWAYYNEIDPFAAAWIRNLIDAGLVMDGEVDERSIVDVAPDDVRGFLRAHFFAGIAGWDYALRLAGWPDDRPVWTGSCPCQPFSAAGKGGGFADERHLWPAWHHLIRERRPAVVFGEQVASKDGLGWLDLVQADLEGSGYACGAADLCAAGIGAPHIRQRQWWVGERLADPQSAGRREQSGNFSRAAAAREGKVARQGNGHALGADRTVGRLVNGVGAGLEGHGVRSGAAPGHGEGAVRPAPETGEFGRVADALRDGAGHGPGCGVGAQAAPDGRDGCLQGERLRSGVESAFCGLADAERERVRPCGQGGARGTPPALQGGHGEREWLWPDAGASHDDVGAGPRPVNGLWRDADWLFCRDGKWRPVEPGTFPLAHGVPGRVGRLRAYGNAIVPQVAAEFIRAYLECRA
ncbi:DNA cytosine methyltransferase [Xanthobacter flavus]|uniref:DNA cytosine methyltransferase n=1 Tax=Xanthobacter flavus TaxID=281 RepID=UPI00372C17ED